MKKKDLAKNQLDDDVLNSVGGGIANVEMLAQQSNLPAQKTYMVAQKSDILTQKTDLLAQKTDMVAQKPDLLTQKVDLLLQQQQKDGHPNSCKLPEPSGRLK